MKRLLIASLASSSSFFIFYLFKKRQTPWSFAKEKTNEIKFKKTQYYRFNRTKKIVQNDTEKLQQYLKNVGTTVTTINYNVEKFKFKLEHRLVQIKMLTSHIHDTLKN